MYPEQALEKMREIADDAEIVEQVVEKTLMKCESGSAKEYRGKVQTLLSTCLQVVKRMKDG